jgi:hypothetical protein
LEIKFNLTVADLVRFNVYHATRRVVSWIVIGVVVFVFAKAVAAGQTSVGARLFITAAIALLATTGYFVATALVALVSYVPSKNRGVLGEHLLSFDDVDITEKTAVSTATWSWESIPNVARNRRYVFIYVQQNMAHIVPKRAFASREEADRFFDSAYSTWKLAVTRSPTPRSS